MWLLSRAEILRFLQTREEIDLPAEVQEATERKRASTAPERVGTAFARAGPGQQWPAGSATRRIDLRAWVHSPEGREVW